MTYLRDLRPPFLPGGRLQVNYHTRRGFFHYMLITEWGDVKIVVYQNIIFLFWPHNNKIWCLLVWWFTCTNSSLSSFGDLHVTICPHLTPPGKKGVLDLRRTKIWNYKGITFCNLWITPVNCNDFVNCSHALFFDQRFFLRDCEYSSTLAGAQRIRTLVCENGNQRIRTLVCEKRQLLLVCEFAH